MSLREAIKIMQRRCAWLDEEIARKQAIQINDHWLRAERSAIDKIIGEIDRAPQQVPNESLDQLELSVRALNCFRFNDIKTISDLLAYRPSIMSLRNMGPKTFFEIEAKLSRLGYVLPWPQHGLDKRTLTFYASTARQQAGWVHNVNGSALAAPGANVGGGE